MLFGLIKASPPPFGLDPAQGETVRAAALLVALWVAVFTLPFLLWVKDPRGAGGSLTSAVRGALPNLVRAVRRWPPASRVGRFLVARMLYTDGLNTLFAFGGVYAAGTRITSYNVCYTKLLRLFMICASGSSPTSSGRAPASSGATASAT